ncbi:MAG: ankyrin repeat domain-containing protein [Acidiferrobacterales bacterium]
MIRVKSVSDWGLVIGVALMSIGANLPTGFAQQWGIDRRYLLGGLMCLVGVALVRYLKFTLVLVVAILSIGANLPADMATEFGIDRHIMMFALIAMVVVSLASRFFKMPTGIEQQRVSSTRHGAVALFNAVTKGQVSVAQSLLKTGVNVNVKTLSGTTPLMAAASKGYSDIAKVLMDSGADVHAKDSQGHTALSIAMRSGFTRTADMLKTGGAKA